MKLEEFNFSLPPHLIAQYPSPRRGDSRLMVLHRRREKIEHRAFQDLREYLRSGDLLVINNTRVLPARLIGRKETGGRCEMVLIPSPNGLNGEWEILLRGSKHLRSGTRIQLEENVYGEIKEISHGRASIRFLKDGEAVHFDLLRKLGHVPLPPYIRRPDEPLDRERYQTIFAAEDGSIAAPTAGLHFTQSLVEALKDRGVAITFITLHVGVGTFAPVRATHIETHKMGAEWMEITEKAKHSIEETKQKKGRVIAVGTTTTRALESAVDAKGRIKGGRQVTDLFIHPPYRFRVVDALITNFHLPKSTLILLVSAWAGRTFLLQAYAAAVSEGYRFYSYGDAMLIL